MEGMQYAGEFQIKLAEVHSPNGEITNLLTTTNEDGTITNPSTTSK